MRVAFDTNILIDAIANRGDYQVAQNLIMAVAQENIEGIVTASSVTDIYYIARKYVGDEAARMAIQNILTVFDIASVGGEDCATALGTNMKDFEDAVLAVCASREGADYIATRDVAFIGEVGSPVRAMTPDELLKMID